jgi:hypothetical protein
MGITTIEAMEAVASGRSERPIIKVYRVWSHPPIKGGIEWAWETAQPGKQKLFGVKGKTVRSRQRSRVGVKIIALQDRV